MKIVFFGDSITKATGYGGVAATDAFAHLIGVSAGYAPSDIINAGVGGNNTADLLSRLDADVIAVAPAVCVVMIGNNDFAGTGKKLTAAVYKANVLEIISRLKAADIKPVFISPSMPRGTNATFSAMDEYIQAVEDACATSEVQYVDFYREMCFAAWRGNYVKYYVDTLHLSKAGHQFLAEYAMRSKHTGFFIA